MTRINDIQKLTDNRFLNLYRLDAQFRDGSRNPYYAASRRRTVDTIKARTHDNNPDGVVMFGVYGPQKDRVVLIRQFRYPIDGYVYEFPAGLVEPGENAREAGIREMFEETGLTFTPREGNAFCRPFFTSVGMTDESCAMVYGYCQGVPTSANQEGTEDIQVVLADRAECRRILKEENVAIMCAYHLMHFLASAGDPLDFLEEGK
ncbi:MAG: NUDIX hydrolase [Eubacteriales bacterium]|nr:NUDIX hydrolase [Eubacteriales bacterium]